MQISGLLCPFFGTAECPVRRLTDIVKEIHTQRLSDVECNFVSIVETPSVTDSSICEFGIDKRNVKNSVKALPNKLVFLRQPRLMFAITPKFEEGGNVPYAISSSSYIFEMITNDVSIEYLEAALNDRYVIKQLEGQRNDRLPSLSFDFDNIFVPVPFTKEEQDTIVKKFNDEKKSRYAHLALVYAERAGIRTASSDLSHMIGAPMYKVGNAIAILEDILADNDEGLETIDYLKDNLAYAERLIKANSADFSKYPKSRFSIVEFFQDYIRGWKNYGSKNFVINDFLWVDDDITIYGSEDAFKVMLDAILDNANRHAFRNTYSVNHQVGISLDLIDEATDPKILLDITNNGVPMPQDYTLEDFIESGNYNTDSGRSGLGGKHIYDIITSFGGEMEIVHLEEGTGFLFFIPVYYNHM